MKTFAFNSFAVTIMNASVHVANYIVFAGIAALFGVTWQTDAFFLAWTFPSFFVGAIVSAVGSVFIPIFAECKINRPHILGQLIGSTLLYVLICTLIIVLLMSLTALYILRWVVFDGVSIQFQRLVIHQTLFLLPVIVIQTLTGVISAFYNASDKFLYPPVTDAISTLTALLVIAISKSSMGIFSVPLGFVCGAALHLILLGLFWHRFNIRVVWGWKVEPELRRSLILSLPLILGTAALQLGTVITRFLAAQLPEGSVTILDYASRVAYGVMELLTSGVLLVVLAKWSKASLEKDTAWLRREVQNFLPMMLFVVVPVVTLVIVLRQSLVVFAFQRGNFDSTATIATAGVLLFYLLGIPIDAVGRTYVRLLLIWQRTWIVGGLAILRVIVTVLIAAVMMWFVGVKAMAIADTIGILFITVSFSIIGNRRLGNTFSSSGRSLLKIGISALGAGLITKFVGDSVNGPELVKLLIAGSAGSVSYLVFSWVLLNDQMRTVIGLIKPSWLRDVSP